MSLTTTQLAWVTHAPADYLMVFREGDDGEHAIVRTRFADEDAAWDAAAGLEGAELVGPEVRVYCALPHDAEQALAHLAARGSAHVRREPGRLEFVAVGDGSGTDPEDVRGDSGNLGRASIVMSHGGDSPRCYRFTRQCERCGEFVGKVNPLPGAGVMIDTRQLHCRCQGIRCHYCDTGLVRRPLTDHFDPERRAGHTPWFGYLVPCGSCQATGRGPRVLMSLG